MFAGIFILLIPRGRAIHIRPRRIARKTERNLLLLTGRPVCDQIGFGQLEQIGVHRVLDRCIAVVFLVDAIRILQADMEIALGDDTLDLCRVCVRTDCQRRLGKLVVGIAGIGLLRRIQRKPAPDRHGTSCANVFLIIGRRKASRVQRSGIIPRDKAVGG